MGNSFGVGKKRKTAKVMKIDGTVFRPKTPTQAGDVLRDHPGYDLLESEDVKRLGLRAQPLHPEHPLGRGKLYFLIELPRLPDRAKGPPRRAWSGALHVSAKDRLENLKLSRRSVSDLSMRPSVEVTESEDGVRVRMRLPKAEVTRVVDGSMDAAEVAEKIMRLCMEKEKAAAAATASGTPVNRSEAKVIN